MKIYREHQLELQKALQGLSERIKNTFSDIDFSNLFPSIDIFQIFKEAFDPIPDSLKQLSSIGWYMSMSMTPGEINGLAKVVEENNFSNVDAYLVDHFRKNYKICKERIYKCAPERKKTLLSAFNAHERKDYFASIPLFLSQADGICYENTEKRPYKRKNYKPQTAEFVEGYTEDSILKLIISPLAVQGLINANVDERKNFAGTLNRHEILHGISLDYGNEIDGYKAISWINYICEISLLINDKKL